MDHNSVHSFMKSRFKSVYERSPKAKASCGRLWCILTQFIIVKENIVMPGRLKLGT
jgi:hypothetical protein